MCEYNQFGQALGVAPVGLSRAVVGLVGMWPVAMGTTLRPSAESSLAGVKPVQPAPWTP